MWASLWDIWLLNLKRNSLRLSRETNASHGGCVNDSDMETIIGWCCEKLRTMVWYISDLPSFVYENRTFQIPNRMFSVNLNVRESIGAQFDLIFAVLSRQLGDGRLVLHKIDAGLGLNMIGEHMVSISYVKI